MSDADAVADRVIAAVAEVAPKVRDGLVRRRGDTLDRTNPTGDRVIAADAMAEEHFFERLAAIDGVGEIASEDSTEPRDTGTGVAVAIDPLDGSSNITSNNLVGTIVGVYDAPLPAAGSALVAAAYVVYGPITTMVVAADGTVTELAIRDGDVLTLDRHVTLPDDPVVYGFGGAPAAWTPGFRSFAEEIKDELKLRYGGAMVGDVNQVLSYGGLFSYPALDDRPEGKLRLQFEAIPMGAIIEAAGGRSSNGSRPLTAIDPDDLHDRTPVHLGNAALVERLEHALDR